MLVEMCWEWKPYSLLIGIPSGSGSTIMENNKDSSEKIKNSQMYW